jgi:hypothetical protein
MKQLIILLSVNIVAVSLLLNLAAPEDAEGHPLSTTLTGAAQVNSQHVPNQADPDGGGTVYLTLNQGQGEICFEIQVENIDQIVAAHIHAAPAGQNGPVVVDFAGRPRGCTTAAARLIKAIRQHPENYYVNVHTSTFPGGAVRGQLSK